MGETLAVPQNKHVLSGDHGIHRVAVVVPAARATRARTITT